MVINHSAMTEEEKKQEERQAAKAPDAVEQAIKGMESRAASLRKYASSPIRHDTEVKRRPYDEYINSEAARRLVETPEQAEARQKRERRNRRLAALADGLVALSNVAGAMGGATPIKPSSMTAAQRQAVERAAAHRRENAKLYDNARRHYADLQYKQDKDAADRLAAERKARRDAGKQADSIDAAVAKMRQAIESERAKAELARLKAKEQARHKRAMKAKARGGGSSRRGSGSGSDELRDAYKYWMSLSEKDKNTYRDMNKRGRRVRIGTEGSGALARPVYGTQYMDDDDDFIMQVWKQRKAYLINHGREDEIASGGYNNSYYSNKIMPGIGNAGNKMPGVK